MPVDIRDGATGGQLLDDAVGLLGAQLVGVPPVPVDPDVGEPPEGEVC